MNKLAALFMIAISGIIFYACGDKKSELEKAMAKVERTSTCEDAQRYNDATVLAKCEKWLADGKVHDYKTAGSSGSSSGTSTSTSTATSTATNPGSSTATSTSTDTRI